MLYRYSVENYKSFRDRAEISFFPTSTTSNHHVSGYTSNIPVLNSAIIYGANASGKSNLIKSLAFFKRIVVDNDSILISTNNHYLLEKKYENKPSVFVIEAKIGKEILQYGLAVVLKEAKVVEEWLYSITKNGETEIFSRSNGNTPDINKKIVSIENKGRYKVYTNDLNDHSLFLTEIATKKNIDSDSLGKYILSMYKWFKNLRVVFPNTRYNIIEDIVSDDKTVSEMYVKFFNNFGIDIAGVHTSNLEKFPEGFPQELIDDIRKSLIVDRKKKAAFIRDTTQNIDYLVRLNPQKEIVISDIRFEHKKNGNSVDFRKTDESDGTQRLFDLIPIFNDAIKNNRVVVIDEIDRSLHSSLTLDIFKTFHLLRKKNGSCQLICTTHDTSLMNLEYFRQEEIWFVEKEDQVSSMFPLDKFLLKDNISNISSNYLLGKYGSLPKIVK